MLSKLFTSAKTLFNLTPQTHISEEPSNSDMVTTRQQIASQEGASAEDPIVVEICRSSKKRSRKSWDDEDIEKGDEVFATPAKKKKVLPLRERDEDELSVKKKVVVEIPAGNLASHLAYIGEGKSERRDVEGEDAEAELAVKRDSEESESIQRSENKVENELVELSASPEPTPSIAKKEHGSPFKKPNLRASPVQPRHKRFDSEDIEPEPPLFSTALEIQDTDEESSEDDAPEVVGAQEALVSVQSKAREAAKAVGERDTAIRKKRKERDVKLKEQAEVAARKRERVERKIAKNELKQRTRDQEDGLMLDAQDAGDAVPAGKASINKTTKLPDLLPDEYLQDDEEVESLADSEIEITRPKSNKKKFFDLVEQQPKDRKIGSTTYRVSKSQSKFLAPKSSSGAKNTKEAWLNGRGPTGARSVRKVASAGFFKK